MPKEAGRIACATGTNEEERKALVAIAPTRGVGWPGADQLYRLRLGMRVYLFKTGRIRPGVVGEPVEAEPALVLEPLAADMFKIAR